MNYFPHKKHKSTFSRVHPRQPTWSVCLARLIFLITHAHQVRYSARSCMKRISQSGILYGVWWWSQYLGVATRAPFSLDSDTLSLSLSGLIAIAHPLLPLGRKHDTGSAVQCSQHERVRRVGGSEGRV
jgi:hypothetical protein